MAKAPTEAEVRTAILIEKRDELLRHIVELDLGILVLERTDPSMVVARKVNRDREGREISSSEIKAAEFLEEKRTDRADYQTQLDAVRILLKQV